MPLLILLMVGLIFFIFQLPGASKGFAAFIKPDFTQLFSPSLVVAAMGQAFFSLSIGVGGMMVYGSYLKKNENIAKLSIYIAGLDTCIALMAGLLIIPAMFVAQDFGGTIYQGEKLIDKSQLIFQILPTLFNQLNHIGLLLGFAFFSLLSIASLTSMLSSAEVPVSYLTERKKLGRSQAAVMVMVLISVSSSLIIVNFNWLFSAVITLLTHYLLPIMGMVYFIVLGWFKQEPMASNTISLWQKLIRWHLKYFCPVLMFAVLLHVAFS